MSDEPTQGQPCLRWPACHAHRELADLLGHDTQGHAALNALVHARITTVADVAAAYLTDVRNLGRTRIARIRQRLAARPRSSGKGDRP